MRPLKADLANYHLVELAKLYCTNMFTLSNHLSLMGAVLQTFSSYNSMFINKPIHIKSKNSFFNSLLSCTLMCFTVLLNKNDLTQNFVHIKA